MQASWSWPSSNPLWTDFYELRTNRARPEPWGPLSRLSEPITVEVAKCIGPIIVNRESIIRGIDFLIIYCIHASPFLLKYCYGQLSLLKWAYYTKGVVGWCMIGYSRAGNVMWDNLPGIEVEGTPLTYLSLQSSEHDITTHWMLNILPPLDSESGVMSTDMLALWIWWEPTSELASQGF